LSHGGAIDGFRVHMTLVPKAKMGIALLNNLERTQMNLALSNTLVDQLLGLPFKDWNTHHLDVVKADEAAAAAADKDWLAGRHKGTKPSRELSAYAGAYEDAATARRR